MFSLRNIVLLTVFVIIVAACDGGPEGSDGQRVIPDIDSLMSIGADARGQVRKTSVLNGATSTGHYAAGEAFKEELEVFRSVESMNLPVHRDHYRMTNGQDQNSNLTVTRWVALDSAAPVRSLRLFRRDGETAVLRLEAEIVNNGFFFTKSERLLVDFDAWNGRPEHYTVIGRQRIAWLKEDGYAVNAEIEYIK